MLDPNFPVFDVGFMLAASRRTSWRNRILEMAGLLLDFFQKNNLLIKNIEIPNSQIPPDFKIVFSDLNESGQHLVTSGAIDRWLSACDRNINSRSVRVLERALKKYRSSISE